MSPLARRARQIGRVRAVYAFVAREEAATMVEYALMITFIALVCFAAVSALGQSLVGPFQTVIAAL